MMILDPINAVTSIEFYRKAAAQAVARTAGYLCYLAFLFSLIATVAIRVRVGPEIDKTFVWLEKSMPTLTLSNGKMISKLTAPLTLRHPDAPDVAVTIDTARVDPVTPQMLETQKVMAYISSNALYVMRSPGELRVFDFTTQKLGAKPFVIDAPFYESSRQFLDRILYPFLLVIIFVVFALWKTLAALFYSLVGISMNSLFRGALSYASLFNIAAYAQTLMVIVFAIFLFMPTPLPWAGAISFIATSIYIALSVKKIKEPQTTSA
jgi:uncharacterized membrane protein